MAPRIVSLPLVLLHSTQHMMCCQGSAYDSCRRFRGLRLLFWGDKTVVTEERETATACVC